MTIFNLKKSAKFMHHIICISMIFLCACAGGGGDDSASEISDTIETGAITFEVDWKDAPKPDAYGRSARRLDCEAADVVKVMAEIFDGSEAIDIDSWPCSLGKGTIEDVPAGSGRKIVLSGLDAEGNLLYFGKKERINIIADAVNDVGIIEMYSVEPEGWIVKLTPVATIDSPSEGSSYREYETVEFRGRGNDAEDGKLDRDSLIWISDIDGQIGMGEAFSRDDLSVGTHRITLTATDSDRESGTASVTFTVTERNTPVTIIDSLPEGSSYKEYETVEFRGDEFTNCYSSQSLWAGISN